MSPPLFSGPSLVGALPICCWFCCWLNILAECCPSWSRRWKDIYCSWSSNTCWIHLKPSCPRAMLHHHYTVMYMEFNPWLSPPSCTSKKNKTGKTMLQLCPPFHSALSRLSLCAVLQMDLLSPSSTASSHEQRKFTLQPPPKNSEEWAISSLWTHLHCLCCVESYMILEC